MGHEVAPLSNSVGEAVGRATLLNVTHLNAPGKHIRMSNELLDFKALVISDANAT